jgi:hypothetical protein
MREQDKEFLAKYGEAMLYSHLIEDLLLLIMQNAAHFQVNGYCTPQKPLGKLRLEELIDEFGRAFPPTGTMVDDLHRIRKILNKLTHAFVPQVGSDLLTEEGRDQINAMLDRFCRHAFLHRQVLGAQFDAILKRAVETDFTRILEKEEDEFDARVAKSVIQQLLDEMDSK